ncbi:hypothetical protein DFH94DRAFT_679845 [Russula ochroleuca]|uniref:Uncharacterized protein n=1 Tax=Russula ochroleuca TaxID=152965 RepID=A0A9P5N0B6_9AGAM|nr:hypothetical protein DFH94DRAFT_679845 [Russula ochroleuca]
MYCKARDRPVLREANAKTWRVYKCVHDQGGRDKYLKREGRDWQKPTDDPSEMDVFALPTLVIGQTLTPARVEASHHMHKNESSAEQGLEGFKCVSAGFGWAGMKSAECPWIHWGEVTATDLSARNPPSSHDHNGIRKGSGRGREEERGFGNAPKRQQIALPFSVFRDQTPPSTSASSFAGADPSGLLYWDADMRQARASKVVRSGGMATN